ncbi:MAG: hypothetical protein WDN69_18865 [Aliidongia sp.]
MTDPDPLHLMLAALQTLPDPFDLAPMILEQYRQKFGAYPDVIRPKGFNEKIQARKIFDRRPILTVMADKVAVRDYVAERVGREVLRFGTMSPTNRPTCLSRSCRRAMS